MIFRLFPTYKHRYFQKNNKAIEFILLHFKTKAEKAEEFAKYRKKLKKAYHNLLKIKKDFKRNTIIYEETLDTIDNLKKQWQILKEAEQLDTKFYANITIIEENKPKDYQLIALINTQEYYKLIEQFELLYIDEGYIASKAYSV